VPGLLAALRAQPTAVDTLRRALATDRVHHAYLFDGPNGVGKELAAFGLAQALVCQRREPGSPSACGECSACTRAVPRPAETRPVHPDVVVLERGLYEPATIGRRTPETQDLSIDQVRTLVLARAAFPPHEGRAKVFIVRRAEEMNQAAANALLKTLEEPGPRTHFILLSSVADSLLPTIRSRTQRVRFAALPDDVVAALLTERGVERATSIAALADGSMAVALDLGDPEATARREDFVGRAVAAVNANDLEGGLALAEEAKKVGRETSMLHLEALAAAFAAQAREAVSGETRAADVAAMRHALTLAAVEQIDANASTQLAMEAMFIRLRAV
jgi:DNA polymerase-3 subunit delta'